MTTKYTFGADPEVFMCNPNNGQYVSALELIPGDKMSPFELPNGGAVQVDGLAAEFNMVPADTPDDFVKNVRQVFEDLKGLQPGYNFVATPAVLFDEAYFENEVHPMSKVLGCNADFNAWTLKENPIPTCKVPNLRTGAGHIHIGWDRTPGVSEKAHFIDCARRVRQLDYYVGIYSLLWDADPTRRQLYGSAGAFRPKPYGLEYRVLSNVWLNSDMLMRWIFHAATKAMHDYDIGKRLEYKHQALAQAIIDDNYVNWAETNTIDTGLPQPPKMKVAA